MEWMYKRLCTALVDEARIAAKLDNAVYMNKKGEIVKNMEQALGNKFEIKIDHAQYLLFLMRLVAIPVKKKMDIMGGGSMSFQGEQLPKGCHQQLTCTSLCLA